MQVDVNTVMKNVTDILSDFGPYKPKTRAKLSKVLSHHNKVLAYFDLSKFCSKLAQTEKLCETRITFKDPLFLNVSSLDKIIEKFVSKECQTKNYIFVKLSYFDSEWSTVSKKWEQNEELLKEIKRLAQENELSKAISYARKLQTFHKDFANNQQLCDATVQNLIEAKYISIQEKDGKKILNYSMPSDFEILCLKKIIRNVSCSGLKHEIQVTNTRVGEIRKRLHSKAALESKFCDGIDVLYGNKNVNKSCSDHEGSPNSSSSRCMNKRDQGIWDSCSDSEESCGNYDRDPKYLYENLLNCESYQGKGTDTMLDSVLRNLDLLTIEDVGEISTRLSHESVHLLVHLSSMGKSKPMTLQGLYNVMRQLRFKFFVPIADVLKRSELLSRHIYSPTKKNVNTRKRSYGQAFKIPNPDSYISLGSKQSMKCLAFPNDFFTENEKDQSTKHPIKTKRRHFQASKRQNERTHSSKSLTNKVKKSKKILLLGIPNGPEEGSSKAEQNKLLFQKMFDAHCRHVAQKWNAVSAEAFSDTEKTIKDDLLKWLKSDDKAKLQSDQSPSCTEANMDTSNEECKETMDASKESLTIKNFFSNIIRKCVKVVSVDVDDIIFGLHLNGSIQIIKDTEHSNDKIVYKLPKKNDVKEKHKISSKKEEALC